LAFQEKEIASGVGTWDGLRERGGEKGWDGRVAWLVFGMGLGSKRVSEAGWRLVREALKMVGGDQGAK